MDDTTQARQEIVDYINSFLGGSMVDVELEPKDYWQWQGQSFTAHTVFLSAFSQVGPCLLLAEIATCEPISSAQPVCSSSPLSNEPVASCCIGP